ncbi:hypothetical protein [Methylotenera sp. 1P/1]|uniref:hypothetical protein n=1 Tax=Methylotenera sp. 1P/1 TaxID=1131551 RepID=UPI00036E8C8A|nr:hypothetical protein [Methylotenera sp. 1P/1]
MSTVQQLMGAEILKTFIQFFSWPLIVLIILFMFKVEIGKLLSNIKMLKVGNLEIDFHKQLMNLGFNQSQLEVIKSLNAKELDLFLMITYKNSPEYRFSDEADSDNYEDRELLYRLRDAGLITITHTEKNKFVYIYQATPNGLRLRGMIINGSIVLLHGDNKEAKL